jgi:hypothetical protein
LKTFEIGYKGFYCEHEDWFTEYVEAENSEEAFQKLREERLALLDCEQCGQPKEVCQSPEVQEDDPHEFKPSLWLASEDNEWEEGDWLMVFRYVKEVTVKPCPHCGGTGQIAIDADNWREV